MTRERRQYPRMDVDRRAKFRDGRTGKYLPCLACNISRGGAMVRFDRPVPVAAGDRFRIGVAGAESAGLLFSTDMIDVEVVRSLSATDGRTAVAVRFLEAAPVELEEVAMAA